MTTMRYRATACPACGNHTVMTPSGICLTCVSQSYPAPRRRIELAIIYAAGLAILVAFVLVVLTGHVRAEDFSSLQQTPVRIVATERREAEAKPFTPPPCVGIVWPVRMARCEIRVAF